MVHLAAEKLQACRQRLQQEILGRRGRTGDVLYKYRKTLLTRCELLTPTQAKRLNKLWAADERHVALEVTWRVYQDLIAAYNQPNRQQGKAIMKKILTRLTSGVPAGLEELAQLGRSLWRRRKDILAFFDVGASNGPVEAINGRLEHLRGIALGFRNLKHYVQRCLIHSGKLQLDFLSATHSQS